ncbi:MAG: peptidase domain-containing ABC transporter [Symploca sp. SIO2G7]|nr:peptidase domain-containing ABC transporter [Symploca sp. SIO2G7]
MIIHFAKRLELGLVLEFGRKLLHLPLNYFESHRSGEVISRLQDVQMIYHLVAHMAVGLPGQMFIALVSLVLMVVYSPSLSAIALVTSILMTIVTLSFLPALQRQTREALVLDAENQGFLVETFKGAMTLKTMVATRPLWEELQDRLGRLSRITFHTAQLSTVNTGISQLVSGLGNIVLLWSGSHLVMSGQLSIGQLLAFYSMNRNFMGLINMVVSLMDEYARVQAATDRLSEVIDTLAETSESHPKDVVTLADNTCIQCQNLSFFYGGQTNFINQLSIEIPGGQVTAIVGSSGCGKSTLVKLIAGLYPLQSGNIRLGHYNLQDLPLDCLRNNVVLVPQEAHFWSRSIIENFRLAAPGASLEKIVDVCWRVGADDFIGQLPQSYQTVLGEFGANLSGGQRQRLAIARALLGNPPVLILDEAMSGLDHKSEIGLLEQLLAYRRGKTTILISHRPSVLSYADWLIELEAGELIRQSKNSHSDLLSPVMKDLSSLFRDDADQCQKTEKEAATNILPLLPEANPHRPQWSHLTKTG